MTIIKIFFDIGNQTILSIVNLNPSNADIITYTLHVHYCSHIVYTFFGTSYYIA